MRNAQLIDKCINEIGKAKFSFDKKTNEYLFNNMYVFNLIWTFPKRVLC